MSLFDKFCAFAKETPTPYNFCSHLREVLLEAGFTEINPELPTPEKLPTRGFLINSSRSIFAYKDNGHNNGIVLASHSDSPCFILKPVPEENCCGVKKIRLANYGEGALHTWVDRPLKVAGLICYRSDDGLKAQIVNIDKPVAVIPSKALHFDLKEETWPKFDLEESFCPIIGTEKADGILDFVCREVGIKPESVVNHNLRFTAFGKPTLFEDKSFSSGMMSSLVPSFTAVESFIKAEPMIGSISALVVFDNKEIGSMTKNGSATNFISDCLLMLCRNQEEYRVLKENTLVVKCVTFSHNGMAGPSLRKGPCCAATKGMSSSSTVEGAITLQKVARAVGVNLQTCRKEEPAVGDGLHMMVVGVPVASPRATRGLASLSDIDALISILVTLCASYEQYKQS